ncbi:BN860_01750g1_1 [Zygosaccharomyces bailii CLIB 213]|uniref:Guanine nucleotide-binding protein alpha-2 subunit n=1 Tax=Zygosaccharomyces bailii (strain CLIB 213 / ATCC 58445 / CBS 680 / BCRC 21525 / NBRC 1098 / NCYC 1416 / NRRL Y-2227) TaxID=1333698 RepID=A0A8J2T1C8_ZYGB2|nr:BN860_01750g1_1 [Zygosaccharomyces bailii CLIB 213]
MGICGSKSGGSASQPPASAKADHRRAKGGTRQEQPQQKQQKQQKQQNKQHNKQHTGELTDNSDNTQLEKNSNQSANGSPDAAIHSGSSNSSGKELKVLLLGAGESGKSTIIQQLKILHQNGFSEQELLDHRPVVFDNVLEIAKCLVEARSKFNVPLEPDAGISEQDLQLVEEYQYSEEGGTGEHMLANSSQFPPQVATTLVKLWELPSTKQLLNSEHRSEFYLMDSAAYFVNNVARISKRNYIPNVQDILYSRQKTSGIFDEVFDMGSNLKLHIYDVGGQRSERKKWIHCFDSVTIIIFCVALSEYDQFLLEDQSQNRFQESLVLFDNVVNSRWFSRTSVVLFLNKIDLFAEKLKKVPLETYFPDYTGGQDINKAAKYILWRFVQLNRANLIIYPHVTQATDTSNIKLVFAAIKETILENSLKDSGVL